MWVKWCQRRDKVVKIKDQGYKDCGILEVFWTMSTGVEDNECPNQGLHGLLFPEKKGHQG
jgi:hypothetical protein